MRAQPAAVPPGLRRRHGTALPGCPPAAAGHPAGDGDPPNARLPAAAGPLAAAGLAAAARPPGAGGGPRTRAALVDREVGELQQAPVPAPLLPAGLRVGFLPSRAWRGGNLPYRVVNLRRT